MKIDAGDVSLKTCYVLSYLYERVLHNNNNNNKLLMYSCTYMKELLQRGKLNEVRVLAAWNNHRG